MAKKKETAPAVPRPNDGWIYSTEIEVNGRKVVKGTELKIAGERGRFLFNQQIDTGSVVWVDVYNNRGAHRAFYPDRIKVVHVKNKTDVNLAKAYKAKKASLKD